MSNIPLRLFARRLTGWAAVACVSAALCPGASGQESAPPAEAVEAPAVEAMDDAPAPEPRTAPRYRVVIRKVGSDCRVFFLAESSGEDQPAGGVKVTVREPGADEANYETRTDDDGAFRLPPMEEGLFEMTVGLLTVNLEVLGSAALGEGQTAAPKSILIMIPRNLGELAPND